MHDDIGDPVAAVAAEAAVEANERVCAAVAPNCGGSRCHFSIRCD